MMNVAMSSRDTVAAFIEGYLEATERLAATLAE
jgi:hypothetical protein